MAKARVAGSVRYSFQNSVQLRRRVTTVWAPWTYFPHVGRNLRSNSIKNTVGAPLSTEQQCELLCSKCGGKSEFKENSVCFCEVPENTLNDNYLEMEKSKKDAWDSGLLLVFIPAVNNRYERCVLGLKNQLGARGADILEKAKHKLIHKKKKKKVVGDVKAADDTDLAAANPIEHSESKIVGSKKDNSEDEEGLTNVGQAHMVGSVNENAHIVGSAKEEPEIVGSPHSMTHTNAVESVVQALGPVVSPIHREETE